MSIHIPAVTARQLRMQLVNSPVAPGSLAHLINVGTDPLLDALEQHYFVSDLAEGVGCFKYLEGDYGSGKTQFINSLAQRAQRNGIVSAIVNVGQECPFSSPLAILHSIMAGFHTPQRDDGTVEDGRGIEVLIRSWIQSKLREHGIGPCQEVPDPIRRSISQKFTSQWLGAPDMQMAVGLLALASRLLEMECGAEMSAGDYELISWVRGDDVRSKGLAERGLHRAARDDTAFSRLKTVVEFLRRRLGYRGFFLAFDEGTRTVSFRRGSAKRNQAIENMLTMINENGDGKFGGVMFLYAATPDFRSEVIANYVALRDRIGSVAFQPGRPMVPLIDLSQQNNDETLQALGERLLDVFEASDSAVHWDREMQQGNVGAVIAAERDRGGFLNAVPPRFFVYHFCRLLEDQCSNGERQLSAAEASAFVDGHWLSEEVD